MNSARKKKEKEVREHPPGPGAGHHLLPILGRLDGGSLKKTQRWVSTHQQICNSERAQQKILETEKKQKKSGDLRTQWH